MILTERKTLNSAVEVKQQNVWGRLRQLGLHRISALANSKFGHFSQIRLRPNFWLNLADANATAVRSVSYLITDKN